MRASSPRALGRERDAGERRAQVLLDVDRERAQRRDVEDAAALARRAAAVRPPAGRSPTGTPRASCPSRSARGSACGRPPRSRPSPALGGGGRGERGRRTTRGRRGRRPRASRAHPTRTAGHGGAPVGCCAWHPFGACSRLASSSSRLGVVPAFAPAPSPTPPRGDARPAHAGNQSSSRAGHRAEGQGGEEIVVSARERDHRGRGAGDVVVLDGPIRERSGERQRDRRDRRRAVPGAQIRGDVIAGGTVDSRRARRCPADVSDVSFTLSGPLEAVARFLVWLAIAVSTLLLGLALVLAPRGADAARRRDDGAVGLGGMGSRGDRRLPVLAVLLVVSVLGLPLGIALLLRSRCCSWSGFRHGADRRTAAGRRRSRWLALLFGWLIASGATASRTSAASSRSRVGSSASALRPSRPGGRGVRGREARPAGKHRAGAVSVPVDPTGSREAPGL